MVQGSAQHMKKRKTSVNKEFDLNADSLLKDCPRHPLCPLLFHLNRAYLHLSTLGKQDINVGQQQYAGWFCSKQGLCIPWPSPALGAKAHQLWRIISLSSGTVFSVKLWTGISSLGSLWGNYLSVSLVVILVLHCKGGLLECCGEVRDLQLSKEHKAKKRVSWFSIILSYWHISVWHCWQILLSHPACFSVISFPK